MLTRQWGFFIRTNVNVAGFSDKGLHALWHGVKVAFDADSESIELGKEPEFGVRAFIDWKEWSD